MGLGIVGKLSEPRCCSQDTVEFAKETAKESEILIDSTVAKAAETFRCPHPAFPHPLPSALLTERKY